MQGYFANTKYKPPAPQDTLSVAIIKRRASVSYLI